jgi:hypothetical protein
LIELDPSCAQFETTKVIEADAARGLAMWKNMYRQAFSRLDRGGKPNSGDPFLEGWNSQATLTREVVVSWLRDASIDMAGPVVDRLLQADDLLSFKDFTNLISESHCYRVSNYYVEFADLQKQFLMLGDDDAQISLDGSLLRAADLDKFKLEVFTSRDELVEDIAWIHQAEVLPLTSHVALRVAIGVIHVTDRLQVRIALRDFGPAEGLTAKDVFGAPEFPGPLNGALASDAPAREAQIHLAVALGEPALFHTFLPNMQTVTLTHRQLSGMMFVDASAFTVSGKVAYPLHKTNMVFCGVAGVELFEDDQQSARTHTDAYGRWDVSASLGETLFLQAHLTEDDVHNHTFTPPFWRGLVTGRVADANFVDTLLRRVELTLVGGDCELPFATEQWTLVAVRCPMFKFEYNGPSIDNPDTIGLDERMQLPAMDYYAKLAGITDSPISPAAVRDYFSKRNTLQRRIALFKAPEDQIQYKWFSSLPLINEVAFIHDGNALSVPTCENVETEDGCLCKPTSKDMRGLPYSGCSADGECEAVETCEVVTATRTHKCNSAQHLPMALQQGWNYTLELSVQENYIRFTCPEVKGAHHKAVILYYRCYSIYSCNAEFSI